MTSRLVEPRSGQTCPAKTLEVHEIGDSFADVTEGLGSNRFIWERCRYDWSRQGSVTATVQDSNILEPGSSWELKATSSDHGARVESIFAREYKPGFKGRLSEMLFRLAGKRLARWDLRRARCRRSRRGRQRPRAQKLTFLLPGPCGGRRVTLLARHDPSPASAG